MITPWALSVLAWIGGNTAWTRAPPGWHPPETGWQAFHEKTLWHPWTCMHATQQDLACRQAFVSERTQTSGLLT